MMYFLGIIALLAIGAAAFYRSMSINASALVVAIEKQYIQYRDYSHKASGYLEDTKADLAAVAEERDALVAELQALQDELKSYDSELEEYGQQISKQLHHIRCLQKHIRADAQSGQQVITKESFIAAVKAAGLRPSCYPAYWEIGEGADYSLVRCWPKHPRGFKFEIPPYGPTMFGTVADAINLAGLPGPTQQRANEGKRD